MVKAQLSRSCSLCPFLSFALFALHPVLVSCPTPFQSPCSSYCSRVAFLVLLFVCPIFCTRILVSAPCCPHHLRYLSPIFHMPSDAAFPSKSSRPVHTPLLLPLVIARLLVAFVLVVLIICMLYSLSLSLSCPYLCLVVSYSFPLSCMVPHSLVSSRLVYSLLGLALQYILSCVFMLFLLFIFSISLYITALVPQTEVSARNNFSPS